MIKASRYHDRNRRNAGADQPFGEMFRKEQERVCEQSEEKKEEGLRRMEGQNQYNSQAREVFFLLSRTMDYKA
ncbi:MAG: hypothetical protein HFG38_02725 [Eubacterium sp.]|nr:hypothetical protein [Eubacterium sp.]